MSNVLLIVLLILSIVMTGLILVQRSEGGALGIGGGGGGGGFMSGRGTVDAIQKLTAWMGAIFLAVCMLISISFNFENRDKSLLDTTNAEAPIVDTATPDEPVQPISPEQALNNTAENAETENSENKSLNNADESLEDKTPLDDVATKPEDGTKTAEESSQKSDETPK